MFAGGSGGGFAGFYEQYLNYPGFEIWKFLNLGIFIAILVYLLKKPLSAAFKAKRESIRAELIRAEDAKQAALEKLTSAEARLIGLDGERSSIMSRAEAEAETERQRVIDQTESDVKKIRHQTESEVARVAQQASGELRRFSAEESIRFAEEKLRGQINAQNDAQLVRAGIRSIGEVK